MLRASRLAATLLFLAGFLTAGGSTLAKAGSPSHSRRYVHRKERHREQGSGGATPRIFSVLQAATTGETKTTSQVAIEKVLQTPCSNTGLLPNPGNLQLIREATLCLINQERAQNNEPPLQPNPQLETTAQTHSEEMITDNYFAHTSPNGQGPAERAITAGYLPNPQDGYDIGENIAWGLGNKATPQATVTAWINSPEHLENILETHYQNTGIGITPQTPPYLTHNQPGATYTQDFGAIEEG